MRVWALVCVLWLVLPLEALGWNEKGHLAIARLAWLKLDAQAREACTQILKKHPHYEEYLAADKPEGISTDEWAFMRASYWPDWIRSNHSEEFNRPSWHYVTAYYVPPYSRMDASSLPGREPNVVTQIAFSQQQIRSGSDTEKAIYLCWLLHLVGDIHQPLHCCSQLSEAFPEGDQGGNLAIVRLQGGMPLRLHFAWDEMLGPELDLASILNTVDELDKLEPGDNEPAGTCEPMLPAPAAAWAREGFKLAETHVYLNGDLRPCHTDQQANADLIPNLSNTYVQNAVVVAKRGARKAGLRLAASITASLR